MIAAALDSEADLLAEVISSADGDVSPELAKAVLKWRLR